MTRCRTCGAEIVFMRVQGFGGEQKNVPLDPDYVTVVSDRKGTCRIITDDGRYIIGTQVGESYDSGPAHDGRKPHYTTCSREDKR